MSHRNWPGLPRSDFQAMYGLMKTRFLILLTLIALPLAAAAEIYKYVDQDGVVRYTDKPPSKDARPMDLPPPQTYTSGDGYRREDMDSGEDVPESILTTAPLSYGGIELTSPTDDQVFNNADPQILASVQVQPELQPGHRVVFLVDGLPFPAPAGQTSIQLGGLDRGSHALQAAVMDERDAIQVQSASITFHLHQPSIQRPKPVNALPTLP